MPAEPEPTARSRTSSPFCTRSGLHGTEADPRRMQCLASYPSNMGESDTWHRLYGTWANPILGIVLIEWPFPPAATRLSRLLYRLVHRARYFEPGREYTRRCRPPDFAVPCSRVPPRARNAGARRDAARTPRPPRPPPRCGAGRRALGDRGVDHLPTDPEDRDPGGVPPLRARRSHRRGGDFQPGGHGDGRAAARIDRRLAHPPGGFPVGVGVRRELPLPDQGRRPGRRRRLHRRGRADARWRRHRGGERGRRPRPRQPRDHERRESPGGWRGSLLRRRGVALLPLHARRAEQLHPAGGGFDAGGRRLRTGAGAGAARRPRLRFGDPHPLRRAGGGDDAGDLHARCHPPRSRLRRDRPRGLGLAAVHDRGGGDATGGVGGIDRLPPGPRPQLRRGREHRRGRDVQLSGDGDRRAAARAPHRRQHAAGGLPEPPRLDGPIPLRGDGGGFRRRRHRHRGGRADAQRRHHPQRRGGGCAARARRPRRRRADGPQGLRPAAGDRGAPAHDEHSVLLGRPAGRLGGPPADQREPVPAEPPGGRGHLRPAGGRQRRAHLRGHHRRQHPACRLERVSQPARPPHRESARRRRPRRHGLPLRAPGLGFRWRRRRRRRQCAGLERRDDPRRRGRERGARPRQPRHRQPGEPPGGGHRAHLRRGGGPALSPRPAGQRPAAGGDGRRRDDLRAHRAGRGHDALPAPGPLVERRHAHHLGHADQRHGRGLLHPHRHRRRRRYGDADLRPFGGDGSGGGRRAHHVPPGFRRRLPGRRDDHRGGDLRPGGDGDRRAATGAHHRQRDPAGDGKPRRRPARAFVPLPGDDERPRYGRHLHHRRRADARRRDHPQRQGRERAPGGWAAMPSPAPPATRSRRRPASCR